MTELDKKINDVFAGSVVRKDLVKEVKNNAIVPSFVLEYLLAQYCATNDETTIREGIETVKGILAKHYVNRDEAELVKSYIHKQGKYKIIDQVQAKFDETKDCYLASFSNLDIKRVVIDAETVQKKYPRLLVSSIWCMADLGYQYTEDRTQSPWLLHSIKPIQLAFFDLEDYKQKRASFTTEEWIDLIIQSIGFNPEELDLRGKMFQLIRLIPFCERNYNLIELGPKGTGKSHIYTEFSPHGTLLSGGEATVAKLFVNNAKRHDIGLVGYWDNIAFDEFAGRQKNPKKELVDIMKGYMANKSFSRGVETLGADASMTFIGNTSHSVPFMLKNSHLFEELPKLFVDSAFLDRLHFYIPGWEVSVIKNDLFTTGYGLVVDYLAEALKALRNHDYSNEYKSVAELSSTVSTRDRDGIVKTFSGLMKIIYPDKNATSEERKELLKFAIEGRKRVKDQILRIDKTFSEVDFAYIDKDSEQEIKVQCREEIQYNQYYSQPYEEASYADTTKTTEPVVNPISNTIHNQQVTPTTASLGNSKRVIKDGTIGLTFEDLFGPYLQGAKQIKIRDPYIRNIYQFLNLMEFLVCAAEHKDLAEELDIRLITCPSVNEQEKEKQVENLNKIQASCKDLGVIFSYVFESNIHDRSIEIDDVWNITLGRGLDIYNNCERKDFFSLTSHMQKIRPCKEFEITYLKKKLVSNG